VGFKGRSTDCRIGFWERHWESRLCKYAKYSCRSGVQEQHVSSGHGTASIFEVTLSALQLDCRPVLKINLQIYHWCVNTLPI